MLVYTSVTKSYIPKARVLAKSVKRQHPDWQFQLVLSDDLPAGFALDEEPFDGVLTLEQLSIPNWRAWAFGHTVVELCTAVKGVAAMQLADRPGVDKIMYLDPDIKVFGSLQPLADLLDQHEILLTPHLLHAEETDQAIRDNEISALKHGVYNLGFFAARSTGQGQAFISWWARRLLDYCIDDIPGGLFTDQRWCDLAPCFFDRLHVVRDPGCNVATWNIAHRPVSVGADGTFLVSGQPLRFYHFTGYDSGDGLGMLMRYAANQAAARRLWDDYASSLAETGHGQVHLSGWRYATFDNGVPIPVAARRTYRERVDLQNAFPDPYRSKGQCFMAWWQAEQAARVALPAEAGTLPQAGWLRRTLRPLAAAAYQRWPRLVYWRQRLGRR